MNSPFAQKIFQLRSYWRFMTRAVDRYAVHSPFVYGLISGVIKPGSPRAVCGPVEVLRQNLRHDRSVVLKTDYGSGAAGMKGNRHRVSVSSLARYSSVPDYRAARLFYLVRQLGASSIVEFGTSLGISAAYMAKANPSARIMTMEGCPEVAARARQNMESLNIHNVTVVEGEFERSLEGVLRSFDRLDLVFFDGNHRMEPTLGYFRQCLEKIHNESVFVFDDIHSSPEMENAWKEIVSEKRVTVSVDLYHMGWVFFRKELSPQHFVLRYP